MIEINKHQPTAYDMVFPVFGGKITANGIFEPHEIYGTAFYINNNFFLTCAHTIKNANSIGITALGFQNDRGTASYARVQNFEIFEINDTGIIQANIPRAVAYPWLHQSLAMANDIASVGFPFGYDRIHNELLIRSFKGYITMVGFNHNFSQSPHYELSFQAPKGLSGAPLLFNYKDTLYITGQIIGNEITEMIVDSFKEKTQEGDKLTIYEKTEAFHRGIAIRNESFYLIYSNLLNTTFIEYLILNGLLK